MRSAIFQWCSPNNPVSPEHSSIFRYNTCCVSPTIWPSVSANCVFALASAGEYTPITRGKIEQWDRYIQILDGLDIQRNSLPFPIRNHNFVDQFLHLFIRHIPTQVYTL